MPYDLTFMDFRKEKMRVLPHTLFFILVKRVKLIFSIQSVYTWGLDEGK